MVTPSASVTSRIMYTNATNAGVAAATVSEQNMNFIDTTHNNGNGNILQQDDSRFIETEQLLWTQRDDANNTTINKDYDDNSTDLPPSYTMLFPTTDSDQHSCTADIQL